MKIHAMVSNGIIAVAIASALFFGMKAASKKRAKAPDPDKTAVEKSMPATELPLVKPRSGAAFETSQEDIERLNALKEEKRRAAEKESNWREIARMRPSWSPQPRDLPPEVPLTEEEEREEQKKRLECVKLAKEYLAQNGITDNSVSFSFETGPDGKQKLTPHVLPAFPHKSPTIRERHSLVKRSAFDPPSNSPSNSPSDPSSP